MERRSIGLDHFMISVADLDAAKTTYERLGFIVTAKGHHVGWGTANHVIPLQNQYLELCGRDGDGPDAGWVEEEGRHPGLWQLGFKTANARELTRSLASEGVEMEAPYDYSRPITLGGATRDVRFVVSYLGASLPLPARSFFCEQQTPDLIWRPEWQAHPNGVLGVEEIVLFSTDPAASTAAVARYCEGVREGQRFRTRNSAILFEASEAPRKPPGRRIRLSVADPARTAPVLEANGVAFERRGDVLTVRPADACGVELEFVGWQ